MAGNNIEYPYNLLNDVFTVNPIKDYPSDILGSVEYVLSFLDERDRQAIYKRYHEDMTLREIGESFGVTHERARQIVNRAIFRLRHPKLIKYLRYGVRGVISNEVREALDNQAVKYKLKEKIDEENIEKDVTIRELYLSTRANNCLRRAGCQTASDIINLGYDKLIGLRCMGKKTYNEIIDSLEIRGFDCFNIRG